MRIKQYILSFVLGLSVVMVSSQANALVIIDEVTDMFVVGGFTVYGNNEPSGTGQNYEVLKFKPLGNASIGFAFDGSLLDQAPHGNVVTGDLWSHLNANGVTYAKKMVFGFDVNQNTDYIDIENMGMALFRNGSYYGSVFLNERVRVYDDISGNGSSTAEARFEVDLGFDFMAAYNAASTDEFIIAALHSSANAGFEEYFLSAAFTAAANVPTTDTNSVPEPMTMMLLGSGLIGAVARRKILG